MEFKKLEIIVLSAKHLPDIRNFGIMKVYAEVSINGNSKTAMKSAVDEQNECNPFWNTKFPYTIAENAVQKATGVNVVIKLFCERTFGDRYIGKVKIPIWSLFDRGSSAQNIEYPIGGTTDGILSISYNFGEKTLVQKPSSGWDTAFDIIVEIGFNILIEGTLILITGGAYTGG